MADNNTVKAQPKEKETKESPKKAKESNRALILGVVLVVLVIVGILYFNNKFKKDVSETQTPGEEQTNDTTQEFTDLQTSNDDFTELDNSLAALGG